MWIFFLLGVITSIALNTITFLVAFIETKIKKVKVNFHFDLLDILFQSLFLGFLTSLFFYISNVWGNSGYSFLIIVFFASLIPLYSYVIYPFRMLFANTLDSKSFNLNGFKYPYKVIIIDNDNYNAYSIGVIPYSKSILIEKKLLEKMNEEEIKSVILHEIGHLKRNHLLKLFLVVSLISIFSASLFYARSLLFSESSEYINALSVFIVGGVQGFLLWYIPGKVEYFFEYQADAFSAKEGGKENMINALKKLDMITNGGLSQNKITHPNLSKRIKNINSL